MRRASLFVAACALAACSSDVGDERFGVGSSADTKECPAGTLPEGIDVSDGQGTIDWAKVKGAGIAFAVMKATQGTYDAQKTFAANWKGAKAAGVARGAYHFFDPTEDGALQAAKFLDAMGPLDDDDLAPMLDVECPDGAATCLGFTGGSGDAPASAIKQRIVDFLDAVEAATGRKPILYTFPAYFASNAIDTTGLDAYPIWPATLSTCVDVPAPWTRAAMWQWSWTGSIAGISGDVDRDRMVRPIDDLLGWPAIRRASPTDVDGDGKSDVCARGPKGLTCALASGAGFAPEFAGPAWSDASGWRFAEYASTVQLGDVDGDGKADACARAAAGITCALSTGHGFGAPFAGPKWSDADGWNAPAYYATIALADVDGDGKSDVCGRGPNGITCARSLGTSFAPEVAGPPWSDAAGWSAPAEYATIRFVDLDADGKSDVCGRSKSGLTCALSNGAGFGAEIAGPAWSDAAGWSAPAYASTIAFADVNGDGRPEACARGADGITCASFAGTLFMPEVAGPAWSDAAGWNDPTRYATITFVDFDGDGLEDVCGRAASGVVCARSTLLGFGPEIAGPAWSDAAGWNEPRYARTIAAADVNGDGKGDLCARGAGGVTCATSNGAGFDPEIAGPAWSDAAGWGVAPYWGTVRAAGKVHSARIAADAGAPPPPEDDAGPLIFAASAQGSASGGCSCRAAGSGGAGDWSVGGLLAIAAAGVTRARRRGRSRA